jgi:hypothetical protein
VDLVELAVVHDLLDHRAHVVRRARACRDDLVERLVPGVEVHGR